MKECPKCGSPFDSNNQFCSRKCACSRGKRSEEVKEKIRSKLLGRVVPEDQLEKVRASNRDPERIQKSKSDWKLKRDKISFEDLSWQGKKKRILEEQDNKCNHCGLSEWRGERLPLEIDHVDGDRENNSRLNLEGICPNCHSLTPTWRKSKKSCRDEFPEERALELIQLGMGPHEITKNLKLKGSYYYYIVKGLKENFGEASL